MLLSLSTLSAGPKAAGTVFSATCVGLSYEHSVEEGNFISLNLNLDIDDIMWMRAVKPGGDISVIWNIVFAEKESESGNRISFFAGPGIMAGWVTDFKDVAGAAFGLKGRIGVECSFKRPVTLSASLSPILGCHITSDSSELKMRLYKSGLLQMIIPEIGIKYTF